MTPTMKDLGIDRLSPEQRIALALEIWESLDEARPPAPLSAEQRAELARRDAEMDANPGIALTWEQIAVSDLAGRFADDPDLRNICTETYRDRDAEPME